MATFSVTDQTRRAQYTANGSTTEFSFSFQVNNTSDIKVDVNGTTKTESTHYDIKTSANSNGLNTDGTGKVVFRTSPSDHTPANNEIVTVYSDHPLSRTSVYTSGGNITAASLENDFDTITMVLGSHEERMNRAIQAPVTDPVNVDLTLPIASTRASKIMGFDANGDFVVDSSSSLSLVFDAVTIGTILATSDLDIKPSGGQVNILGTSGQQRITFNNDSTPTIDIYQNSNITTLAVSNPSANRTITFPDTTGTVALTSQLDLVNDTTPQLGGTLDLNGNRIEDSTTVTIKATGSADIDLQAAGGQINILDGTGTQRLQFNNDSTPTIQYYQNSNNLILAVDTLTGARTLTLPDATDTLVGKATTDTLTNKTLTNPTVTDLVLNNNITGTAVLDQDDMSSNSATKLATQQSIKAYVDAQVASVPQGDITGVVAGTGLTGGGLSGTVSLNINATTGLTATSSTLSIDSTVVTKTGTQTLTNKTLTSPVLNTGVSGTAIKDEDTMVSNSASHLATQQSIKAYVDAQVAGGGAGNLSTVLGIGNTTAGNNIVFGDSSGASDDRLTFGADADLQIYHDGSSSLITDTGTGNLTLTGSSEVTIENAARSQYMLRATDGGDVKLFHNGSEKIATTSTGVDVTGTLTADGLTVDSSSSVVATIGSSGSSAARLYFDNTGMTTAGDTQLLSQNNDLAFNTNGSERMRLDSSGLVGIGTTSPSSYNSAGDNLVIAETSGGAGLTLASSTTGSGHILFADGTTGTGAYDGFIRFDHTTSSMRFASGGGTERMRIDSSGQVGIGTSSPSEKLHVSTVGSSGVQTAARFSSSTDVSGCKIERDGSAWRLASQGALHLGADYDANGTAATSLIVFEIDGTERMRIDSSGNVGIGTTSLSQGKLVINGGSDGSSIISGRSDGGNGNNERFKITAFADGGGAGYGGGIGFQTRSTTNVFSEAMRINSSGNVGIGTSSPSSRLDIRNTGGTYDKGISIQTNSGGNIGTIWTTNTDLNLGIAGAHIFTNYDGSSERMRIDSSGNLRLGTGSGTNTVGPYFYGGNVATGSNFFQVYPEANGTNAVKMQIGVNSTASRTHIRFFNNNGVVGSITTSGSSTAYNTSSDYRLKENVVNLTGATERLKQLEPKRFNFIVDADTTVDGFLAHEVSSIVPEAITGTKDAMRDEEYEVTPAVLDDDGNIVTEAIMGTRSVPDYQGIDQSKLVPLLVATIKELEARITALEAN